MRALPALAALGALALAGPAAAGVLTLALNHSVRLPVAGPAASVVVGSPTVVDVAVVDSRTVFVSGRSPGETDVTVIDPLGRIVFRGDVAVTAGGSSVNVYRGATRSQAVCAPYCRTLSNDEAGATPDAPAMAAAPSTPGPFGSIAAAVGGAGASTTHGVAAVGQALSPPSSR